LDFSAPAVDRALVAKITEKTKSIRKEKPQGRPVDELKASLYKKLL